MSTTPGFPRSVLDKFNLKKKQSCAPETRATFFPPPAQPFLHLVLGFKKNRELELERPEATECRIRSAERVRPPGSMVSKQNGLDYEMNVSLIASAAAPRLLEDSGEG